MPRIRSLPCGGSTLDKYTVKLTGRARRDLDSIYTYIAKNLLEPGTAMSLVERIENEILALDRMPYRWPERQQGIYANKGYRQMPVENYTVIYRVDEVQKQVIIVTVRYAPSSF